MRQVNAGASLFSITMASSALALTGLPLAKVSRKLRLHPQLSEDIIHPLPYIDARADLVNVCGGLVDVHIQLGHVAEVLEGEDLGEAADAAAAGEKGMCQRWREV